jgi:hypothetical protein
MEQNNEIQFEVMVMYTEILEQEISFYNSKNGTDFRIIEIIDDGVIFCRIGVTIFTFSDIYNLGYSVSALQHKLRQEGKIDW